MFKLLKRHLLACAVLIICGSSLKAQTSSLNLFARSDNGRVFADASGNLLPFGDSVRIGIFNVSGANLATLQTSNSYAAINALFTPLGEGIANSGTESGVGITTTAPAGTPPVNTTTGTGVGLIVNNTGLAADNTGNTQGKISGVSLTYLPAGTLLYAWVFNTTFSNKANATQWGIFTTSAVAASPWNSAGNLGTAGLSTANADLIAIRGSVTGTGVANGQARLTGVPEPSTYALLGTGLLTTFTLLRRRKMA